MEIFATKQFAAKFKLCSLSMKRFLGWFVKSETVSSPKIVQIMEAKMTGGKKGDFTFILCDQGSLDFAKSGYGIDPSVFPGVDCFTYLCSE